MSLKDGKKKMSKSEISEFSRINLKDTKDQILNKIKKAKTDTFPLPENEIELNKRPEAKNLLGIFSSLNDQKIEKTLDEFSGKNFSDFKKNLSDLLIEKISPISDEIKKLNKDNDYIDKILEDGAIKAASISSKKVKKLKDIVGF